jgi:hypothetical protein
VAPATASIWLPYTAQAFFEAPGSKLFGDEELWLSLSGRLNPGVTRSQAEAELSILARRQDLLHPGRETEIATTDGSWIQELNLTSQASN